jgi:hypothetical protein
MWSYSSAFALEAKAVTAIMATSEANFVMGWVIVFLRGLKREGVNAFTARH